VLRTLFIDTQVLIYAFEKSDPSWVQFVESRLLSGYRLVMSEVILDEFGQSPTLEAALNLTRRVVELKPLWIRSFADIKTDEVCRFARTLSIAEIAPLTVFVENFLDVSQSTEEQQLNPDEFVKLAFNPLFRDGYDELADSHAEVINKLSLAVSRNQFTKELKEQSYRTQLRTLLSRGSDLTSPLLACELENAIEFCFKHHKKLMRECCAYATEDRLVDIRTSTPKRRARKSDSRDLMLAAAAFPYVSTFVTNDGYLYDALFSVKRNLPHITTELIRIP
jgi:predicted nucleic acid-binding protein